MLDKALGIVSCFDWISPLAAWIQDIANGPSFTFLIPCDCGWTGHEIQRLLNRRGIHTWGHMIVEDTIMLTVRQCDYRRAAALLDSAGLPFARPL